MTNNNLQDARSKAQDEILSLQKAIDELGAVILEVASPILVPIIETIDGLLRKVNEKFNS